MTRRSASRPPLLRTFPLLLGLAPILHGQAPAPAAPPVPLAPFVVTAGRAAQPPAQVPFSVTVRPGEELRDSPATTLDGALRSIPAFSLFRRSDSLTANPTAQGVSLRGLGPSGASRSLVLLDGVPLNDPFGGWIAWTKVPRLSLDRAELLAGGGATAWGNAALGGVVQLLTEPVAGAAGRFTASGGAFATRSAELALTQPVGPGTLRLAARAFFTDGFRLVAPGQRGPVDVPAASRHHWYAATWTQPMGDGLELSATGRHYAEQRGNGTPLQRNSSREDFASVTLRRAAAGPFTWQATAYAQDQTFRSTFSAVNAARTAETPASDQFAVPATALGAAWTGTWADAAGGTTTVGTDARRVRGETRENFSFVNGGFTRARFAGGRQDTAGLFVLRAQPLAPALRATLGARLDGWRETRGHRREADRATGAMLRDDRFATRDGLEFSPSAGLVWQPVPGWRVRAAGQRSFRRPTLNELHRPFRVGNVITEANAALATESARGAELGVEHTGRAFDLGATFFWTELRDAVANVTVARGPGTFPLFGTLSATGVGRQRLNLERVRVPGAELSARWRPTAALTLEAAYLYSDGEVRHADVAPALVGRRLAQTPRHSGSLGAAWRAPGGLALTARARWLGRQFEDDENLLPLRAAVVVDVGAAYPVHPGWEVFVNVENIGDRRLETGRAASGLINTGTPRLATGGVRATW